MQGLDYDEISDQDKKHQIVEVAARRYLAALFFSGLNGKRFKELKRTVHNDNAREIDTLPQSYANVIKMVETFQEEKRQMAEDVNDSPGVAMVQPGKMGGRRAGRGGGDKDGGQPATEQGEQECDNEHGGVATVQVHPDGTQFNARGRKDCFHCGANDHWVRDCPHLTAKQRQEAADTIRVGTYRAPSKKQQKKTRTAPAAVKSGANIMFVGEEDEEEGLLDQYEGVGFLQKESEETMVVEARETLYEDFIYLDTCSSFHMCFNAKHLAEVKQQMVRLKGDCNAGSTSSREKGWLGVLFHMWLVRNGIAKILSVEQLKKRWLQDLL